MPVTLRRLLRPRSIGKAVFVFFIVYSAYILGLFTHLFEKSLAEFEYPVKINITVAVKTFCQDLHAPKLLELDDFDFNYIHKAESTCTERPGDEPFLVVLVKSKIGHFEQRQVIRETWGRSDSRRRIRTVFLAGIPSPLEQDELSSARPSSNFHLDLEGLHHNEAIVHKSNRLLNNELDVKDQRILSQLKNEDLLYKFELEYEKYGDIVQQNFYDTYYNNTIKTLMGIRWAVDFCPKSKFYLFIDDDFYVNPSLLMKFLSQDFNSLTLEKFYAGFVYPNSSPMRHMMSKWYLSLQDYPYNKFPPYASAGFYLMSQQSSRQFYVASKLVKRFKFDDIHMGILAYKLGVTPMHMSNVYYHAPTYYPSTYAYDILAAHGFTASELARMWNQLETFIKYE